MAAHTLSARVTTCLAVLAATLTVHASSTSAQIVTGGAGNTGIPAPSRTGGVQRGTPPGGRAGEPMPAPAGNAASRSNSAVPGTTPDVVIGGTATSGPPGTGGAAGGPSLSGR